MNDREIIRRFAEKGRLVAVANFHLGGVTTTFAIVNGVVTTPNEAEDLKRRDPKSVR